MFRRITAFIIAAVVIAAAVPGVCGQVWGSSDPYWGSTRTDDESGIRFISTTAETAPAIRYMDLGGAAVFSFEIPDDEEYTCTLAYSSAGMVQYVRPQAEGFIYLSAINTGTVYHGELIFETEKDRVSTKFTFESAFDTGEIISGRALYDGIELSWKDFAPDQIYAVLRKCEDGWQVIAETAGTSFTDTELLPDTLYSYRIGVVGSSGIVNVKETQKLIKTVADPSQIVPRQETITLTWSPVKGADGYYIYRKTENGYVKIGHVLKCVPVRVKDNGEYGYEYAVAPYFRQQSGTVVGMKITIYPADNQTNDDEFLAG